MQLERQLHRMQAEMENLEWKQNKLQERFQMAVKECKMMEMLLAELEEEHDMAIAKIENLEGKVNILYPCACLVTCTSIYLPRFEDLASDRHLI